MALTLIFKNNSHPRRAILREESRNGRPGGIVESVVCDPGMSFDEATRGLVDGARANGIKADDSTIQIASDSQRGPGAKLVSYPGQGVKEKRD